MTSSTPNYATKTQHRVAHCKFYEKDDHAESASASERGESVPLPAGTVQWASHPQQLLPLEHILASKIVQATTADAKSATVRHIITRKTDN